VLNLIDSVRFNNATFRSGPNQYLAFIDPSQVDQVEAVLGPAAAQYGSDAMGGAIHVLTPRPQFGVGWRPHGEIRIQGATADRSGGGAARAELGNGRVWGTAGASWRRHNDLRAGHGFDSRHVFRRFFGLPAAQIRELTGDTLQDTGFSQGSGHAKLSARLPRGQGVSVWYQQSELEEVRGYKDLWGGLGRVESLFEPQALRFFYARYEKMGLGPIDSAGVTYSLNSQEDGAVRRGLRYTDPVTRERTDIRVDGVSAQAATHIGARQALTFGGEHYAERVGSERTLAGAAVRPLYPDDSRYGLSGVWVQHDADLVPNRLRSVVGGRWSGARYQAPGTPSLYFSDFTFHSSLLWQVREAWGVHAIVSRGFRAPNLNDLGALGLNDLGYEIPAADAAPAGALIGDSAGEGATSTHRPVEPLAAERLFNYEIGARVKTARLYARVQAFDAEFSSPIVRRTLLFPAAAVPAALGALPVTALPPTAAQQAQGVVTVATAFDSRAVKAFVNDGRARYYGLETLAEWAVAARWRVRGNYALLAGRDLNPNRPARRLPPQQGHASVRYVPTGARPWVELAATAAGPQRRLSGGDLDDERIGASRSSRDIAAFFAGSLAEPYIDSRGVFLPTSETLTQIQQRVLPGVSEAVRVPMETKTAGWASVDVRMGAPLGENVTLQLALMNLLDHNYRFHGSGVDAPGRNLWASLAYRW
jgi:outer membrane receptor protein involved in Fe transport